MPLASPTYPVGAVIEIAYPIFTVKLHLLAADRVHFAVADGPFKIEEIVEVIALPLAAGVFAVSWQEASGATVVNLQDFDAGQAHTHVTLPDGQFIRMSGALKFLSPPTSAHDDRPTRNKALVHEAMTALFQRRDVSAVERLYAPDYIQHNPGIPQGRDALAALVGQLPTDLFYEPGRMVGEGNFVVIHGRITGWGPKPQIVMDLFRIEEGRLAEHWDVLQDETPAAQSRAGTAMFEPSGAGH